MPFIDVKLYDRRVTPESSQRIIKELTDALARACEDESVKDHTWVVVQGVPPNQWGIAGNAGS
jgi:4-oxalocrotonate tautomerase